MSARYTLVIGTKDWSSWSLRPWLAMKAVGAPFEEIVIRLRQPETKEQILAHSPAGKVPVLKIAEAGREHLVWDSLAICEALAERHPEAKLWPDDPFVRAEARSLSAEMHSGFPDIRDQLSMDIVRRKPAPELRDDTKTQIARIIEAWSGALARYGSDGGFLLGRFSIADCMYAPVCTRFVTYGIETPKPVQDYIARIVALPAMRDWAKAAQKEVDDGIA